MKIDVLLHMFFKKFNFSILFFHSHNEEMDSKVSDFVFERNNKLQSNMIERCLRR
ncbi:hypothetical protein FNW02_23620 [Komarekiella sp. 'clone 1']|uniref:Uncharacterized protein n=1 Tax=Komarekiella delphini-convector SJRDD-AB1 TaxID=2593771 RepID=A0AA40VT18_9NOST|nr:hypothetical protein [Komarekiella delphini-convector SJRDD-AB1]